VHIVSKITGKLKNGKDALDVIKGHVPGGTITDAPRSAAWRSLMSSSRCGAVFIPALWAI